MESAEPAAPGKWSVLQTQNVFEFSLPTSRAELLGVEPTRPNPPILHAMAEFVRREAIRGIEDRDGVWRSSAEELVEADLS